MAQGTDNPAVGVYHRLAAAVFSCLRAMDAEAKTRRNGQATGLTYYGAHARPELKRPQTEPAWSKRLAVLLPEHGFPATAECRYPGLPAGRRNSCDVGVDLGDGRLWLEVKGAWRDYWAAHGNMYIYRSYLLHPLVSGLDPKTHTVPHDLTKLDQLTSEHAGAVGLLLVGFETDDDPMDDDVAELVVLAGLDRPPWTPFTDRWPAHHQPGHAVRCWLWVRPVPEAISARA